MWQVALLAKNVLYGWKSVEFRGQEVVSNVMTHSKNKKADSEECSGGNRIPYWEKNLRRECQVLKGLRSLSPMLLSSI